MKIVARVKLLPDVVQLAALTATLHGCNESAGWVSRTAFDHGVFRRCGLAGPADVVAAVNVRSRARSAWVHVNAPEPAAAQAAG